MAKRSRVEKKSNKPKLSDEAQGKVQEITNAVVPVGFSKQQRREVQQAIEKGLDKIRTETASKNRDRDKKHKKLLKQLANKDGNTDTTEVPLNKTSTSILPWLLLAATWLGIAAYLFLI